MENKSASLNARKRARFSAVQAIYQWQLSQGSASEIRSQFESEQDLRKTDMDYFDELLTKITRNCGELDDALAPYIDRPIEEIDPVERAILRIAAYEFLHRIDIPFKVIINEAIQNAKKFGAPEAHKFVNGVLDKMADKVRAVEVNATRED